jgi:hypothetical protein
MVMKTDRKYLESFKTWCWKGKSKSVEPTVWKMRKCCVELRRKGTSYTQYNEGRFAGLVTSCVEASWNALLKERRKGRADDEEDLSIYWMTWKNEKTLEFEGRAISHCLKNWIWKRVTEGKTEGTSRRWRRLTNLLDDLEEWEDIGIWWQKD